MGQNVFKMILIIYKLNLYFMRQKDSNLILQAVLQNMKFKKSLEKEVLVRYI